MTPIELRAICDSLNPGGQSKLARMIGVNTRTLRRWLSGKVDIPEIAAIAIKAVVA